MFLFEDIKYISDKYLYEYYGPKMKQLAKDPNIFKKIQKKIIEISDKNSYILQTDIVGRQFLMNNNFCKDILSILNEDKEDARKQIESSSLFVGTNAIKFIDEFSFFIPFCFYIEELYNIKKIDEAFFIFVFTFYKPYASIISNHFPYGVNDDRMRFTINQFNDKFDIKKEGNVHSMLIKKAQSSFDNYKNLFKDGLTDREAYVLFSSGIFGRISETIKKIHDKYDKNKNNYLSYEDTFNKISDEDGESIVDKNIQSNSAIKESLIRQTSYQFVRSPINERLLKYASDLYMKTEIGYKILRDAIEEISDRYYRETPDFISSLLNGCLYETDPKTGNKFMMENLKTPAFLRFATDVIFKTPNTKNVSILKAREMRKKMLSECSIDYAKAANTKKDSIEKAITFYFLLLIQKNTK